MHCSAVHDSECMACTPVAGAGCQQSPCKGLHRERVVVSHTRVGHTWGPNWLEITAARHGLHGLRGAQEAPEAALVLFHLRVLRGQVQRILLAIQNLHETCHVKD